MSSRRLLSTCAAFFFFFLSSISAYAVATEITPADDFEAAVNALGPGDELVLGGGTYVLSGYVDLVSSGTFAAPIVIRAKTGEVPVLQGDPGQNVINVSGQYLEFRDLEITGGAGDGIRLRDTADFITVEGCSIHDVPSAGISANLSGAEYVGLRIASSEIRDTGAEGLYLGCNNDICRITGAEIEGNYIHSVGAEGVDLKTGSSDNWIADNVVHDTGLACLSIGSTLGNGLENVADGNVLWGCGSDGILAVEDVLIQNNIVLGATDAGIHIQALQGGVPDGIHVLHNTVLHDADDAVRVRDVSGGTVVIANNALYAPGNTAIDTLGFVITSSGNVGEGFVFGVVAGWDGSGNLATDFVAANLSGLTPNDVFPAPGSALIDAADPAYATLQDFNANNRSAPHDVGAYEYDSNGNPGWLIQPGFKPVPEPNFSTMLVIGLLAILMARKWRHSNHVQS